MRLTKLVATIGPASVSRLDELVAAGLDVARINLSHGDEDSHRAAVGSVRAAGRRARREIAVLADLPGPKVRLGPLPGGQLDLEAGASFHLRTPGSDADAGGAPTSHARLGSDLRRGDRVLLADGAVELRVEVATDRDVATTVERGGTIRSGAGVSVPSERLSLPTLTDRDLGLLGLVAELEVDYVGQSFVRSAEDVVRLRQLVGADGPAIVAKIETRPAVDAIEAILEVADAVMVARGDLGVELPIEEVPLAQKHLVRAALASERPAIVATQMLESMTSAPRPTRAEASDVANAVLDGADAVMLSGETAIGAFPVLAADAATRIAGAVDESIAARRSLVPRPGPPLVDDARAIAVAAVALADADPAVAWIACFTRTGRTARTLSALRPPVPILAISPSVRVVRSLALYRGVTARQAEDVEGADAIGRMLRSQLTGHGSGDRNAGVLVASTAGGGAGPNIVEVIRIG